MKLQESATKDESIRSLHSKAARREECFDAGVKFAQIELASVKAEIEEIRKAHSQALIEGGEMLEREQALVECIEMFVGYCTDEFAPTPMKIARELLAKHRGSKK